MSSFTRVLAALVGLVVSKATDQCTTSLTFEGLGMFNYSTALDGDYYVIPEYGVKAYTKQLETVNFLQLGIGCQSQCNSEAQTSIANGKWALTKRGSGETFEDNELIAVCIEGCPSAAFPGLWPPSTGATKWATPSGNSLHTKSVSCGTAPQRCTTGISINGFGKFEDLNSSTFHEIDGDFMWDAGTPINYFEKGGDDWSVALQVGCQGMCLTKEQNDMADGKWALVLFGKEPRWHYQLVATCAENCPPAVYNGPPGWPSGITNTKWQKFGGGVVQPDSTSCCERKSQSCDACNDGVCLKQTKYSALLPGIPLGCNAGTSACCVNNYDTEPGLWGHCACGSVPTVCAHNSSILV